MALHQNPNTILVRAGDDSQTLRLDTAALARLASHVLSSTPHNRTMPAALDFLAAYARSEMPSDSSAAQAVVAAVCLWVAKRVLSDEDYRRMVDGFAMPGVSLVVSIVDGGACFELVTLPPKTARQVN
jgi:hypothetical protein